MRIQRDHLRYVLRRLIVSCLLCLPPLLCAATRNIVIILADDLGYGDLGCYGHPSIRTPNLDRMAREGMRFTDFYASAEVCTPSRASLLTGRYAVRSGMAHNEYRVLRRISTGGLPADEITLPERLKAAGYTTALIGKWHLGVFSNNPQHHPRQHGFDYFFGLPHSNDMDPNTNLPARASARLDQNPKWWNSPLYRNEEIIERPADQSTLTRRYADEAMKFIRDNKARPFFLYFAHTFPHVPLFASKKFSGQSPRGLYGDVVEELDASVGEVLETLRSEGLATNTFVFFSSDNGPWLIQDRAGGSAGLLREGKGSTWEGGMRVPGIAWWPGRVPAGAVTRELACNMDLFTTCLKLAELDPPGDRLIDGFDISPVLFGKGRSPRESFLYYRGTNLYAARLGQFKAHFITQPAYGTNAPQPHSPPLLFDLGVDPGESFNVASNHADALTRIQRLVEQHRATVAPVKNQLADPPAPRKAATAATAVVEKELLFIDNGEIRLGVNTNWGAGIAWFSNSRGRNVVNHWDTGRLIQQSYYGANDGSMWDKQAWRWNPVQGGDWRGHPARVLELRTTTNTLYAKSQARHWASGEELPVIFEETIRLTGRLAHVRFKMTYSGTNSHPKTTHEIPAVFIAPEFDTLVLYGGTDAWKAGALQRSKPGWPNESRKMTEHWAAYVDEKDWGLGVLAPIADKLTCYRYAAGQDETKGACSYFAPLTEFAIAPGTSFEYDVWLTLGYVDKIRERFERIAEGAKP